LPTDPPRKLKNYIDVLTKFQAELVLHYANHAKYATPFHPNWELLKKSAVNFLREYSCDTGVTTSIISEYMKYIMAKYRLEPH